jgi:GNAT superfamily N-acetyltransferase
MTVHRFSVANRAVQALIVSRSARQTIKDTGGGNRRMMVAGFMRGFPMPPHATVEIIEAQSDQHIAQAASLIRDFVSWCHRRYSEQHPWLVDNYLQLGDFEEELSSLAQVYAPPGGALLLALVDARPVGCVALRTLTDGICEMKRLFVRAEHQRLGVGRRLTKALIDLARRRGLTTMRLDTGDLQTEAHALYRSLGFVPIRPYYECPDRLRKHLVFMELALRPLD